MNTPKIGPPRPKPKLDRAKTGRAKGTPNKITVDVREMVLAALKGVGGQAYLQAQARDNPNGFLALVAKTMPTKVIGDAENPVLLTVSVSKDISRSIQERLSGG